MFKSTLGAVAVVALAPIASQASNVKHGLQWHYVGKPYSSCTGSYECDDRRAWKYGSLIQLRIGRITRSRKRSLHADY